MLPQAKKTINTTMTITTPIAHSLLITTHVGTLVPVKSQPTQGIENGLLGCRGAAGLVGVLDLLPQDLVHQVQLGVVQHAHPLLQRHATRPRLSDVVEAVRSNASDAIQASLIGELLS